ncbi:FKBP-type peptidylprolyl isomerase [Nitzschia inconspicua]|uniref:peptidylprolyl isomerase n=1 Tax=Nitzschia inconspicua TaxID=303405 RepID=A0A9K3KAZ9_9STRA|nr:FKBP-type peptidylprolyl isomerase [Nitzschia inconspicua]
MKAFAALALVGTATAFSLSMLSTSTSNDYNSLAVTPQKIDVLNRRSFLSTTTTTAASAIVAGGIVTSNPHIAMADDDADNDSNNGFTITDSGLQYKVLQEGTGAIPTPGQTVKAHYTGWLDGFGSDKKFDSSRDRGRPFTFAVGKGQVIRGWDEAFSTMKVGERRQLILPSRLAYGDRGAGGIIPGGATLYFDVELLGIL